MKDTITSRFSLNISQFFQLPLNVRLVKILPFPLLRIYLYMIGLLYFVIVRKQTVKIGKCLHYILKPSLKHPSRYIACLKAYAGIFEHYYEKLLMAYKPMGTLFSYMTKRLKPVFHNDFNKLIESGQGCLLVTGHFGAVEFLPIAMNIQKIKVAMIVRFKSKQLRESLYEKAKQHNVLLIDADQPKVIQKAMQAIKDGRVLITECDEFSQWHPNKRMTLSVFGHHFPVDRTLDFFYKKAKVPAFLGLMRREKGNFNLHIEPLADGNTKTSVAKNAWKKLEGFIFKYPHQWYQWKSAYTLLEEHILVAHPQEIEVMGGIEPTVHPTVY